MPIESLCLTKSVINRNFCPIRQRFARYPLLNFRMNCDIFHLKMNVKDRDDLNICRRTYFVNMHMSGEIGVSRSIRSMPVHFMSDEHMSLVYPFCLIG